MHIPISITTSEEKSVDTKALIDLGAQGIFINHDSSRSTRYLQPNYPKEL
jgi:hypothetical protein